MVNPKPEQSISEFDYSLPPDRIAQFPLEDRDSSKLLVYRDGVISEDRFSGIGTHLSEKSLLIFNDTKVIRARLIFARETGATIEIFCLEPTSPIKDLQAAFSQTGSCTWTCLVGNVKKWKSGNLEKQVHDSGSDFSLYAKKKEILGDGCFAVEFHWEPAGLSFSEILEKAGLVPLPPYITRASSVADHSRYQTIFAQHEGSVAAPTAGLHFTQRGIDELKKKEIALEKVTLHVGLGTFRPVSVDDISQHIMHNEKISVRTDLLQKLIERKNHPVIAVGTTTARTLESLYWQGVKLITDGVLEHTGIRQWDPYEARYQSDIPVAEALTSLLKFLKKNDLKEYSCTTELMIVPGYRFRLVEGMITNFHMPQSTLLLLIAAFIGPDWRRAYQFALDHDFRFLSYGDACLFFFRKDQI